MQISAEVTRATEIEGIGPLAMAGLVPKLSEPSGAIEWYGGAVGTHNQDVYGKLLGLSLEEIEHLARQGVIS